MRENFIEVRKKFEKQKKRSEISRLGSSLKEQVEYSMIKLHIYFNETHRKRLNLSKPRQTNDQST